MAWGLVANFAKPALTTICYVDCTGEEPGLPMSGSDCTGGSVWVLQELTWHQGADAESKD